MKVAWIEMEGFCKHCHKVLTGYVWPDGAEQWKHDDTGRLQCAPITKAEPEVYRPKKRS